MQGADGHATDKQIDKDTWVDKRQPNNGQIDEQTIFQTYKQMQTQIHNQTNPLILINICTDRQTYSTNKIRYEKLTNIYDGTQTNK